MSYSNGFEILRTKLYRPRPPERFLKRCRLLQQLEEGLHHPVTLVTAPAGYGKTMLGSSWLSDAAHPTCWVSLDAGDNDLIGFLTYMIAAVQSIFEDSCVESASLLRALDPPPLQVLQIRLVNELDLLPQKIVLVLDDYHFIQSPEIHSLVVYLVNHMPPSLHMVICSREVLPFSLSLWRARQQVNEIGTRDLCFTPLEAEQHFNDVLGNSLPAETIRKLCDKAEGWITGLHLVAYSLRHAAPPAAFVNYFLIFGSQNIREFMLDQAFLCQPPPIQEFLLKTSILERFSAPLCNAIGLSGEKLRSIQDTLNILSRGNIFIVPLDERGEWFRYHNLFAEMLQRRLQSQSQPEAIAVLHRRAVAWFEANNYIDDAIQHALAVGDEAYAAQIVEQHGFDAFNREKNAAIDRWLAALPPALLETRPRLIILRVWIENHRERGLSISPANLLKTQAILDRLQNEIDPETQTLLEGYISALWPYYLMNEGKFELGVTLSERALKILPPNHSYVRGRALMAWALNMKALGRGDEAVRYLLKERDSHSEVNAYSLVILQTLGCLYAMSGQLDELQQTASSLLAIARDYGFQILTAWAYYLLGLAAYIGNDLKAAYRNFESAANMQYLVSKSIVRESLVGLSLVSQLLGNTDEAQGSVSRLNELEGGEMNEYQRSLQARLALCRNDLAAAQRWSLADPASRPQYILAWLELPHFTQAHIWIATGRPENLQKAVVLLNDLVKIAKDMGSLLRLTEAQIWLACALYQQGKHKAAIERIEEALQLARSGRFIPEFLEAGPLVEDVLGQIDHSQSEYVLQILTRFRSTRKGCSSHPLLTRREIEVLQLLDKHLSEQEIADRLSVSLDTVKKHCYHIYNKLGVNRRRDAVAVAKETGVLL